MSHQKNKSRSQTDPTLKRQTLSLCMIVKNEEEMLTDCLASVKDVVDEMLILDTGSTDKTMDIARSFGATLHEMVWEDDFAKARNESIRHASCDWILWMDADERLLPESIPALKKLLKSVRRATLYNIHIQNLKEDGQTFILSKSHRLFSNHFGLKFTGRIHEQVSPSAKNLGGVEHDSTVMLYHLGYGFSDHRKDLKSRRNLQLLTRLVQEKPDDAYAHLKLGEEYGLAGNQAQALEHFLIAVKKETFNRDMKATLYNVTAEALLKLGEVSEARKYADASLALFPRQSAAAYLRYRLADQAGDWNEALIWLNTLQRLNEKPDSATKFSGEVMLEKGQILVTRAIVLMKNGDLVEARKEFESALMSGNTQAKLREYLVEVCYQLGDYDAVEEVLNSLIRDFPNKSGYLMMFANLKIKQQQFPEAIRLLENYLTINPQNGEVGKRLVALYGKTGQMEKAHALLIELNEAVTKTT